MPFIYLRESALRLVLMLSLVFVPALLAQSTPAPTNPRQPGQLPGPYVPVSNMAKFKYRFYSTFSWRGLVGSAFGAGFNQLIDSPKEWGGGVEGYGKRYASIMGGSLTRQTLNFAFESALSEDPRYFPLDGPSKKARLWNALKQTFLTRTDSGGTSFAYARVASAVATGQITRAWLPPSSNGFSDGMETAGVTLAVDAAVNVLYEFIPRARPKQIRAH